MTCRCQSYSPPAQHSEQITAFYEMRALCPALRVVTIPDDLLAAHKAFMSAEPDDAYHSSVPFLAFLNGRLAEFTGPLHRYLLDGNDFRTEVREQYRKDMRETWILEDETVSRFRSARRYFSRLAEIHFAAWLEIQGWQITNLEAYGASFDVEAASRSQPSTVFEVKFLAQREVVFELNRASFIKPTTAGLGLYSPMDYLLYRTYEAAQKLRSSQTRRIAVTILADYDISFKIQLTRGWIDWKHPKFLRRDSEIESFLAARYAENPNLDDDVRTALRAINEVWFFRYQSHFSLGRVYDVRVS